MRRMKYHPHGSVVFVSLSIEEGLFLLSNPLCEQIIKSCLASAQAVHGQIKVCHHIVEGTHLHLLMVVENPDDVPGFIKCFKTESAHAFNALLNREKRTIWCEGYDSPVVLTPLRAAVVISYIYSNPAKDNLCASIDDYPGLSSWKIFKEASAEISPPTSPTTSPTTLTTPTPASIAPATTATAATDSSTPATTTSSASPTTSFTKLWKRIRRYHYRALTPDSHNLRGYTKEAERLSKESTEVIPFTIYPNAWLEAFGVTNTAEQAKINAQLIKRVRKLEERAAKVRKRHKKSVKGREALMTQKIDPHYCSHHRSGKRMWCLSEERKARVEFIDFFKKLMSKARAIQKRWRVGDYSEPYPPGLYPPCMPKLVEPLFVQ